MLPVPDAVGDAWRLARISRLVGSLNGYPVKRALKSHADGGYFVIVGQPLLKATGSAQGSMVEVVLAPDPTPDSLDIPEELEAALEQDDGARTRWESFTVGKRRSLAYYVSSAKTEATRLRRAVELAKKIRLRQLNSD